MLFIDGGLETYSDQGSSMSVCEAFHLTMRGGSKLYTDVLKRMEHRIGLEILQQVLVSSAALIILRRVKKGFNITDRRGNYRHKLDHILELEDQYQ